MAHIAQSADNSAAGFLAIHLPKIYEIIWGPRKIVDFLGEGTWFPPVNRVIGLADGQQLPQKLPRFWMMDIENR